MVRTVMHMPRKHLVAGVVVAALSAAGAAAAMMHGDLLPGLVILLPAPVGISMIAEYLRGRHVIDGQTLIFRKAGRRLVIPLAEVFNIRVIFPGWIRLRTPEGVARVSLHLVGIGELAAGLMRFAPAGSMRPVTRAALGDVAVGEPGSPTIT